QDVALSELKLFQITFEQLEVLHLGEVEPSSIDVSHANVWVRVVLWGAVRRLLDSTGDRKAVVYLNPTPRLRSFKDVPIFLKTGDRLLLLQRARFQLARLLRLNPL